MMNNFTVASQVEVIDLTGDDEEEFVRMGRARGSRQEELANKYKMHDGVQPVDRVRELVTEQHAPKPTIS